MRNPLITISIFFSILTIGVCLEYQSSKNNSTRNIAIFTFPVALFSAFAAGIMDDSPRRKDSE